jgi:hypothetical protein
MSQKQDISSPSAKLYGSLPIFVLCESCYWCATYLNKTRLPIGDACSQCSTVDEFSSFPILSNESFTFDYNHKRGVELEFKSRDKHQDRKE